MENQIKALLEKNEKEFGKEDGAIITRHAYFDGQTNQDETWCAAAVKVEGDKYTFGNVKWDFKEWVKENEGIEITDDGSYPWDGNGKFEVEQGEYNLKNESEEILQLLS